MASRVFKLLHKCSQQTHSYIRSAHQPLPSRKTYLQNNIRISSESTSNHLQFTEEDHKNKCKSSCNDKGRIKSKSKHIFLQEKGFFPIYKFQYAPLFAAMNKVKWQQLYFTSGVVPLSVLLAGVGFCPTSIPVIALCIGGVITSTLWIFCAIFSRTVGAILLSSDGKTICISYIDGKGRREDDDFPVQDLVPLSNLSVQSITSSWFVSLIRYTAADEDGEPYQPYKMFVQKCDILDEEKFMETFGSLP